MYELVSKNLKTLPLELPKKICKTECLFEAKSNLMNNTNGGYNYIRLMLFETNFMMGHGTKSVYGLLLYCLNKYTFIIKNRNIEVSRDWKYK